MFGHGLQYNMFTVHTIQFGFLHGHGHIILSGGDRGRQYRSMYIVPGGDLTVLITLIAIHTGSDIFQGFTDHTDHHLLLCTTTTEERSIATGQTMVDVIATMVIVAAQDKTLIVVVIRADVIRQTQVDRVMTTVQLSVDAPVMEKDNILPDALVQRLKEPLRGVHHRQTSRALLSARNAAVQTYSSVHQNAVTLARYRGKSVSRTRPLTLAVVSKDLRLLRLGAAIDLHHLPLAEATGLQAGLQCRQVVVEEAAAEVVAVEMVDKEADTRK
jgi:hypothetical protein